MSAVLTPVERRALRRAVRLLGLDRARFALAVLIGTLGLTSAIALSGTAATASASSPTTRPCAA